MHEKRPWTSWKLLNRNIRNLRSVPLMFWSLQINMIFRWIWVSIFILKKLRWDYFLIQEELMQYADNDPATIEAMSKELWAYFLGSNSIYQTISFIIQLSICMHQYASLFQNVGVSWLGKFFFAEKAIEVAHSAANRWTGLTVPALSSHYLVCFPYCSLS